MSIARMTGFRVRSYVEMFSCCWPFIARRANLRYLPDSGNGRPMVEGVFRGYPLWLTCRGLPKSLTLYLEVAITNPAAISMSMYHRGIGDSLRGWLGFRAELTGDPFFDRNLAAYSKPAGWVGQVFQSSALRKQILKLDAYLKVRVMANHLILRPGIRFLNIPIGLQLLATAVNIARAVDDLPSQALAADAVRRG